MLKCINFAGQILKKFNICFLMMQARRSGLLVLVHVDWHKKMIVLQDSIGNCLEAIDSWPKELAACWKECETVTMMCTND